MGQEVASKMGSSVWQAGLLDDVSLAEKQGKAVPFWDQLALGFGFLGPRKRDRFWAQIPRPETVSPFEKSSDSLRNLTWGPKSETVFELRFRDQKWSRFLCPRNQKAGPCNVAMVGQLGCSSASWQAATPHQSGEDPCVFVPKGWQASF